MKKISFFLISLIVFYLSFIGISLYCFFPSLAMQIEKLAYQKTSTRVVVDSVYFKFPNRIVLNNTVVLPCQKDSALFSKSIKTISVKLDCFEVFKYLKSKKISTKLISSIYVKDVDINISKNFDEKNSQNYDFLKIHYLQDVYFPNIKIKNIRVFNILDSDNFIDISSVSFKKLSSNLEAKIKIKPVRFCIVYDFLTDDIKIRTRVLNFKKIDNLYNKIFHFLDFFKIDLNSNVLSYSDFKGKIFFDIFANGSLKNLNMEQFKINGEIITNNFGFKHKNYEIENMDQIFQIKNNAYLVESATFKLNNMQAILNLDGDSIFKKPKNLSLEIQDFSINDILNLHLPESFKNEAFFKPIFLVKLKMKEDGKYNGNVCMGTYRARVFEKIDYEICSFKTAIENNELNVKDIVVDLGKIGKLSISGKVSMDFYDFSVLLQREFVLDEIIKKYTAKDVLRITDILVNLNNRNEKSALILNSEIEFLLGRDSNKIFINKQEQFLNMQIKDILDFRADVQNDLMVINKAEVNLLDNGNLKIVGAIPFAKTTDFRIIFLGTKLKLGLLDDFFENSNLKTDFEVKLGGSLENLCAENKIHIYGDDIKAEILGEYKDKNFVLSNFEINKTINIKGNYDVLTKLGAFRTKLNDIDIRLFFKIAKQLQFIDKSFYEILNKNLKNQKISGWMHFVKDNDKKNLYSELQIIDKTNDLKIDINSYSDGNIFNIDKLDINQANIKKASLKGYIDFPKFQDYEFNGQIKDLLIGGKNYSMDLNFNGKEGEGNLILKNVNLRGQVYNQIKADFRSFQNKIELKNINIDDILEGFIEFRKTKIKGMLKIKEYDLLKNFKLPTSFKIEKMFLNTDLELAGDFKNPIVMSKNLKIHILKNKEEVILNADVKYAKNKNRFEIANGKLFVDDKANVEFKANIKDLENFDLCINCSKANVEIFRELGISEKYLKTELIDGQIYLTKKQQKIFVDTDLRFSNDAEMWIFDVDSAKIKLNYDLKTKKIEFEPSKLYKAKSELEILSTNFDVKDDKNFDFTIDFYMRNWRVFSLCNGLGKAKLVGECKGGKLKGEFVSDNFWFNKYNFRNRKIDYIFEKEELILNHNNFYVRILFTDKGIIIDNINYLLLDKHIKKLLKVSGHILKNRDIAITANAENIDSELITRLIKTGIFLQGETNLDVVVKGTIDKPEIYINADIKNGRFSNMLDFDLAKLAIDIKNNEIFLKQIELSAKDKYLLFADGSIPLALPQTPKNIADAKKKNMQINIKTQNSNLLMANCFVKDVLVKPRGLLEIDLQITNSLDDPQYKGFIKISNGHCGLQDGIKNLRNLNSEIIFDKKMANLNSFYANVGKGDLKISGKANLEGFDIEDFNISMEVLSKKGIELELNSFKIPQSAILKVLPSSPSKGDLKGWLNISNIQNQYEIKGDLELSDASFTYPPKGKNHKEKTGGTDFLKTAKWDLSVRIGNNTWFENEFVNVVIDGKMRIKTEDNIQKLNGDFQILRGDINYIGTYFKVNSGLFMMVDSEPFVELNAETYIQRTDPNFNRTIDDTIILTVERSKLSDIKFRFESQNFPGTKSEEAMSLAFSGGFSEDMSGADKENYMRQEFFKLIDANLATPFIKLLVQKTGLVDFVKVNTQVVQRSMENTSTSNRIVGAQQQRTNSNILTGSSFVIGKYINPNLFVSYSLGLEENQYDSENNLGVQHGLEAKLKLRQNLYLKGLVEVDKANRRDDQQVKLEYFIPFGANPNEKKLTRQEKKELKKLEKERKKRQEDGK